ncbi:Holliday junction branch migration DNA helicase RuvB [Candidatus Deianiraea vastatrix]|uniref:Holliday junction branch migration complex subunit RuvB n=1 Tax=Candidatus Deianiraea vastatrix TaxID=2163644 RepID=A0A5B8XII7_9RICK|nr:Holliday junction branch migration DNA helicase RuvB [Candidatus Deianiraea vastatrix]QED23801.1 Holliday junction ATP-dependent DNA helicase RuvB [Candidatus Deianiraea vastatrix]
MEKNEILNPEKQDELMISLRPTLLSEFIGQGDLKQNLSIFIHASKMRQKAIDHILFYGPPGLGKTTLSQIISKEMATGFRMIAGPMLTKSGDLAAILTNLQKNDVLFIDEIHRLHPSIEEVLYSAMEDFRIDIIIGEGVAARTIKIDLQPFTLIGATTKIGMISSPLRTRFGIPMQLNFYTDQELCDIIMRDAGIIDVKIDNSGAMSIAKRSRGTPRIAIRMLKRVADIAIYTENSIIDGDFADKALNQLGVDIYGLDDMDRRYLKFIIENYNGGPVGIETIASGISEDSSSIEDVIEPYLIRHGLIEKTSRGRIATQKSFSHLGLACHKLI